MATKTFGEMMAAGETPFDHLDPKMSIGEALNLPKDHTQFCVICWGHSPAGVNPHQENCPYFSYWP